jgi:stage II sporulation protein D
MIKFLKNMLGICFLVLFLPYTVTLLLNGREQIHSDQALPESEYQVLCELLQQDFSDMEDGMLELMAVLYRTEIMRLQTEYQVEQLSIPSDSVYYERVRSAVQKTQGRVVQIDGEYRELPYHAVSAGSTRRGELLGESWSYVKSVECAEDRKSDAYMQICYLTQEEFSEAIGTQMTVDKLEFSRDETGYVTSVSDGEESWTGENFRTLLHLPSSCFYMEPVEDVIRITTKGSGHGFGISLYTANEMIQAGADDTEIFQKFYQNAECITIP